MLPPLATAATSAFWCEACRVVPVELEVEDEPELRPYRLCYTCESRLHTGTLRPLEYFNLAALHGQWRSLMEYYSYDPSPESFLLPG